ncbi:hypothetical protein [Methylobacterium oryzihabitans]|uniref:Uncharacterized protein n=1 Tax=Methylobacterium oryzihabitans TaxID=2499852 RepID=A0A437P6X8_9HYPH|nr:hypothetical protein [Methylobacterium oryzihabitans]RVU18034.1 hypothetical protein EOE48_11595 [Methylobacterium oryzihabitans]
MRLRHLLLAFCLLVGFGGLAGASPLMPRAAVTVALDQPSTVETVRWRRHRHWRGHRGWRRHHWHHRHWHHRRYHHRRHWHRRHHVRSLRFSRPAAVRGQAHRWIEPRAAGR